MFTLAACGGLAPTPQPFLPPTRQPTLSPPTPAAASPTETPPPSPTPACENTLTFMADQTIPDGTQVRPGEMLDKRWQVRNSGSCNWDEHYRVKLVTGPEMGAPTEQALYPARGGSEAVIRMEFTAPQEAGTYRSEWQAQDPDGQPFGDPVFIEVVVAP
jgi:hypothetical protein